MRRTCTKNYQIFHALTFHVNFVGLSFNEAFSYLKYTEAYLELSRTSVKQFFYKNISAISIPSYDQVKCKFTAWIKIIKDLKSAKGIYYQLVKPVKR